MKKYEAPICSLLLLSADVLMASDENEMLFDDFKDLLKF